MDADLWQPDPDRHYRRCGEVLPASDRDRRVPGGEDHNEIVVLKKAGGINGKD